MNISKILKEELEKESNKQAYALKINEHQRKCSVFGEVEINELDDRLDGYDDTNEEIVINMILNDKWENPQNAKSFYDSLNKSKHMKMLTDYSVHDLNSMKLFKLEGFNIGYALKEFKDKGFAEIVAVHNNEPNVKGIGTHLMKSAIKNGGCYLDHFDGFLTTLYNSLGFDEYERYAYDPQYDEDGSFAQKYGQQDVIYRVHKNCQVD